MARTWIIVATVTVALIASFSVFTVSPSEHAILFRLGEIVRTQYDTGLHFKVPVINNVRKFDKRIQTLEAEPELYLTQEKKNLLVDSFIKWRIDDVARYYVATGGDEARAGLRLYQIVKDELRSQFGRRTINEVVSGERAKIMSTLTIETNKQAKKFGIDVVDVRLRRVDLPKEVSASVYQRMEAERGRVAKEIRARGAEAAERIRADADRQRTVILAEAFGDAEQIRGEGDALAANIYASAYGKDPEFYSLYRSLNAYKDTFKGKDDIMVLKPDTDFFKYFNTPIDPGQASPVASTPAITNPVAPPAASSPQTVNPLAGDVAAPQSSLDQ